MRFRTKSRRGCKACKARRVRCTEEHPVCAVCVRRNTLCEYQTLQVSFDKRNIDRTAQDVATLPISAQQAYLELWSYTPNSSFSNIDHKLLAHYLCHARAPAQSSGLEGVWATEVPARAQQSPLIMHSLLALAASHLASSNKSVPVALGVLHRQKTISGIKRALARIKVAPHASLEETEALYMASQALAMQTACLCDAGAEEFLSTFRGIGTISALPVMQHSRYLNLPLCVSYRFDGRLKSASNLNISKFIDDLAPIMLPAADSLARLQPYCTAKPAWMSMHQALISWVRSLDFTIERITSHGRKKLVPSDSLVEEGLTKGDAISRLLISYWLTLEFFFDDPTLFIPRTVFPDTQVIEWILTLCKPLMAHRSLRELANWPVKVAKALQLFHAGTDLFSRTALLEIVKHHLELD